MLRTIAFLIILSILFSCGKRVKDINGDEPIEANDFIMSFPERSLPIMFNMAELAKKESDSLVIKKKSLLAFVPDSIFKKNFSNTNNLNFYRKGRYKAESEETYLFLVAARKEKKVAYIICFDKDLIYKASMELMENDAAQGVSVEGGMDKKMTVVKQRNKQSKDGKLLYNKSAYVYNTEGLFTLILTESNEPVEEESIYNPIDSFTAKAAFSGDYYIDKKNFISIRDGNKPNRFEFFISISKKSGGCEGSMRGDMTQVKPKVFQYNKADDHCILEFTFSKKSVQIKELEACGNHRGVRCSFDGQFRKGK